MKKKPNKPKSPLSVLMAHMGTVHMDISGSREVVFEGNKGILEYSSSSIRINAGKYIVVFKGRELQIRSMNACDLVIWGFITSIEYVF